MIGLAAAFGAALAYGVASVLQAISARAAPTSTGVDPRLMLRLVRSWPYLVGVTLDALAFVATLVALRSLPLFAVQSISSSSLAVTALLGAVVLHMALRRRDVLGLLVVLVGLVCVALAAAPDRPAHGGPVLHWALLVTPLVLALVAVLAGRIPGAAGAAALGSVAGLGFGVVAVAARILPDELTVGGLLRDPAAWGLVLGGAVAMLAYPTALQRGSVTQATAPMVVVETVLPSLLGVALLGDQARSGWAGVGLVGFALAVVGALSLVRHAEVGVEPQVASV